MFIQTTATTGTTYNFIIKGENELGEGISSDVLSLVSATKPAIVNTPTTSVEGMNIKV